jgi:hypothetical protein
MLGACSDQSVDVSFTVSFAGIHLKKPAHQRAPGVVEIGSSSFKAKFMPIEIFF